MPEQNHQVIHGCADPGVDDLTIADVTAGVHALLIAIEAGELTCLAGYVAESVANTLDAIIPTLAEWSAKLRARVEAGLAKFRPIRRDPAPPWAVPRRAELRDPRGSMPARSTGGDALSRTLQQLRDNAELRQIDAAARTGFSQALLHGSRLVARCRALTRLRALSLCNCHQQYLARNINVYRCHSTTGVPYPYLLTGRLLAR